MDKIISQSASNLQTVKPLSGAKSILYFLIPALLFRLSIYNLQPLLLRNGITPFWAFLISFGIPLALLLTATFILINNENSIQSWKHRLRLRPLTVKQLLFCLLVFIAGFVLTGLLAPTAKWIASITTFSPPSFLPDVVNPLKAADSLTMREFMGVPIKGNFWIIALYALFLFFLNIGGEELYFRGYVLPRMEAGMGKKAWWIHGLLWSAFHLPIYPWSLFYLLPTTLSVSFAAYKLQNTVASYIVHALGNGLLVLIPLILGALR